MFLLISPYKVKDEKSLGTKRLKFKSVNMAMGR